MALIKCKNCGKEISDKADTCIHCGIKIKSDKVITKKEKGSKDNPKNSKKYIIIGVTIVLVILLVVILIIFLNKKDSYLGKWEHNITFQENGKTTRETYASYELFDNGTFQFNGYSKTDDNDKLNYKGTYNQNNDIIYLYFEYENQKYTDMLYIKNGKMCVNIENCEDYYVKSNSNINNNITINETNDFISYEDYEKILDNKENAIVVTIFDNCPYCEDYKPILSQIQNNLSIPIYFYKLEQDDKIGISVAPTTLLIKNGKVTDTSEGIIQYDELLSKIKKVGLN